MNISRLRFLYYNQAYSIERAKGELGYAPRYTIGVWVGNDLKTQTIGKGAEGAKVALPIWIRILEKMRDHGRIDP